MYFLSVIVLSFLFLESCGRPTQLLQDYDKDSRDSAYRDSDSEASDDYQQNDQKSSLKQFADDAARKADLDENNSGVNEDVDHAHPDKDYLENAEQQTDATHLSLNNDVKRTVTYGAGENIFQNDKRLKSETNEYNDEAVRPIHNDRLLKPYHAVHLYDRDSIVRDRREIKNANSDDPISVEEISTQKVDLSANEDEETAIRRHVKKLSKEELDELLQSLSVDKRALLKNIIDNCQQETDSINKREITKKAEANEENSLVGNDQSDTSKIQGGATNLEADSSMGSKKEDTESTYSKSTETSNSSEKPNEKLNVLDGIADKTSDNTENLVSSETQSKISSNSDCEKEHAKKENKREIISDPTAQPNSVDPANMKAADKQDLYCSDNEAISQLWNEESSLYNDNKYKREVCSDDMDSIKSLEESFPNADNTNEEQIGSDMAPLVRVKRDKEKVVKKIDDNVVSNLKVPYFSSALENNEEESDEGGEFQDDGFFDRGANLATAGQLSKRDIDTKGSQDNNVNYCQNFQHLVINKNKAKDDTAGLGSDSDAVLSGIEGVDDNIMYNSVARIRRTGRHFDDSNIEAENNKLSHENKQQLTSQNENDEIGEEYNNGARYQENDAFGSLPRNYEQDLGRFKRIRRLKHEFNEPATK